MKTIPNFLILALAGVAALAGGCRRNDVRDFTVEIPELTAAATNTVIGALSVYDGVDVRSIHFDLPARRILLRYDSMKIAKKNIEMALAARGLTANGVTPASIGVTPTAAAK